MAEIESDSEAPAGFRAVRFAGIGLVASMIEPTSVSNLDDWKTLVSELEAWGEVPNPDSITRISSESSDRGMIAALSAGSAWTAEFLPWGSDGRLRARAKAAPDGSHVPSGGYTWADRDMILLRRTSDAGSDTASELKEALRVDDLSDAQEALRIAGEVLGRYHSAVETVRTTPPDPSRWNARTQWLEEKLRATLIWRAKYSKNQPCTLSLGEVRLSDVSGDSLRIGRPRLADGLRAHTCEFPAMRDLASLVHDLSRIHHSSSTSLELTPLRLALIEGWKSTAPADWTSDDAFYSHRGGLAIWEYEQCLLDVLEATSHQSGPPEPAVTTLAYVKAYQKRMFSNRTYGALSMMAAFFGIASLVNTFPPALGEIPIPIACLVVSYWLYGVYKRLSPPPERPFTHLG
ncbi:MAG: hypothetical protein CXX69_00790 [Candidatus Thalassarchaeum betae]|uniref:Uncharacterized protein n=1 Tax=Candidatus Thalassarchaeum betae TaxID=2599289 RepID=A0A2V3HUE8_9ARCH|nr:MAG: hypothetical protein CXX69_00790 [Candidatus Thalassoarchaea betae]PXF26741.1 MAG: hypothetical protein CXX70_02055 [Euryarchaeota archaeon]HIC50236.1 hypothetical protein [Candidatus Poseidoniales archaeon]